MPRIVGWPGSGTSGSWMSGSTARTSLSRSEDAAARGHMTSTIVAIITEKRICIR